MKYLRISLIITVALLIVLMCVIFHKDTTVVEIESVEPTEVVSKTVTEPVTVEPIEPIEPKPYFELSDYEREVVEKVVAGEARGESYEGQVLVAQCILNACVKDGIQPSQVRKAYRYGGWYNKPSASVKRAVSDVFDEGYKIVTEPILYFYAPSLCTSKWHESLDFVIEVGCHRFFAERRD